MQVNLVDLDQLKALVRYRIDDPWADAAVEVADYLNLTPEAATALLQATSTTEHEIAGRDPTNPPEEDIYRNSPDYYLSLFKSPMELPHLWYRTQLALSLAIQVPVRSYIDYGGGIGRDCIAFARCGISATHADLPGPGLRFAEWRYQQRNLPVRTIDGTTFNDVAVGMVSCYDVLEHVLSPVDLLLRLSSHVAPNGYLMLAVDLFNFTTDAHLEKNALYGSLYHELLVQSGLVCVLGQHPLSDAVQSAVRVYHRPPGAALVAPSDFYAANVEPLYCAASAYLERQRAFMDEELALIAARLPD